MYIFSSPLSAGLDRPRRAILVSCDTTVIYESITECLQTRAFEKFKCKYENFIYHLIDTRLEE